MSEPQFDQDKFNSDIQAFDQMSAHYTEHENLPSEQRLTNDIRNNIQKVSLRIYMWSRKGASNENLDELAQRGLKKIKELYPAGIEYTKTKELLEETINEDNREKQQTGKPTITQQVLGRNLSAFMLSEENKE